MSYATVLVVDDVVTNLDVARGMLKPYKLKVDCVTSGAEAIQRVKDEKMRYNAIFMDHMMPGMDGIEAVRIIRNEIDSKYAKTVPIIALTANALIGNDALFMENEFQAFLSKPIDILRLDQILHQWVRDRKKEKKLSRAADQKAEEKKEPKGENTEIIKKLDALGINTADALARFDHDEESYLRILHSFVTHSPAFIEAARNSLHDLNSYRIAVHGFKGSSRGIGGEKIGDMAEKLEYAAKQGDTDFIEANHAPFIEAAEDLIVSLSAVLQTVPDEGGSVKDASLIS
jgi:CheY-like chemotaxis protein/HPt (histidine-containing phosphotransfer) domain-containing protein